jgi:hypothetical protein
MLAILTLVLPALSLSRPRRKDAIVFTLCAKSIVPRIRKMYYFVRRKRLISIPSGVAPHNGNTIV